MTEKFDLKVVYSDYRASRGVIDLIEIPERRYLMIDGQGYPNTSPEYAAALAALYPLAYKLKFLSKKDLGRDYDVPPLEGLWWADDMNSFTVARDKTKWQWRMMILVPEWIGAEHVAEARRRAGARGSPPRLEDVRFESMREGLCLQTLHVGPFDDEGPVLKEMHDVVMTERGLMPRSKHHEIYLSDPRRAKPEKLRTILRQPVFQRNIFTSAEDL